MDFKTGDALANIPQRRCVVAQHPGCAVLEIGKGAKWELVQANLSRLCAKIARLTVIDPAVLRRAATAVDTGAGVAIAVVQ